MPCLVGIDVGTTNCKAVAYDIDGSIKAIAKHKTVTYYLEDNWTEFDPGQLWESVQTILKDLSNQLKGESIDGIAIASMGAAGVLLDENDNWIHRSITWFDTRTKQIADWWRKTLGDEKVYSITGFVPNPMAGITKIQWIKNKMPEKFNKVKHWLSMQDYIAYRLTGKAGVDYSIACRTMAMDLKNKCWSKEILNHANIPVDICSNLKRSGELVGRVSNKSSLLTGIKEGTPVYAGGMDYVCGAFASGLCESGEVLSAVGTSEQILMVTDEPANDIKNIKTNFTCVNYVVNDKYYIGGQVISSGVILDWFCNEIGKKNVSELVSEAEKSPIGAHGVMMLPHFRGKYVPGADPLSKGAFLGLTTSHTRGDVVRAILEGLCYESTVIIENLQEVTNKEISCVHVVGGAVNSPFWMQLKADILGKTIICLDVPEEVTLGAAMIAGIGSGVYSSPSDAIQKTRKNETVYKPDAECHEKYHMLMNEIYKHIYPALKETNYRINRISEILNKECLMKDA
ncbi:MULTISPECIES: FGGY-family carbohydrate kinase [Clostridium]|uniref:Xylulose kinase n=4 Tax=Clostridium TaxID=1485 RepID=D8GR87_CLOLD|nr:MULTISPECIES: FGGY family carbohydrate kinase [Clostridium]ADK14225.1 xylulose kinase [Clostridium ljungdahlii DSM 13528]AGY77451.1 FGGY family carbohydrate kinase [Clostridium autoethanogenum DSM 10061]ALU37592.1 Xylulokinase [Clostridium autoethanogenum DSM 10061]OAA86098.1 Xylulose kinase [Clostridium ljungdahlii DSM 13528]OAA92266.1 Xylulose kinase [Clostridium coskatii]